MLTCYFSYTFFRKKTTIEGIFLSPKTSGTISALPSLIIPTHENFVPKSIPIIGSLSNKVKTNVD